MSYKEKIKNIFFQTEYYSDSEGYPRTFGQDLKKIDI